MVVVVVAAVVVIVMVAAVTGDGGGDVDSGGSGGGFGCGSVGVVVMAVMVGVVVVGMVWCLRRQYARPTSVVSTKDCGGFCRLARLACVLYFALYHVRVNVVLLSCSSLPMGHFFLPCITLVELFLVPRFLASY